jgi:release factor glutamine methyltransferase
MRVKIQTIKDIRSYLADELKEIYREPEINSIINLIIMTHLGISKLHQVYNYNQQIDNALTDRIIKICDELKTGKPVQYILGETSFYDCRIKLNNSVLIPRQETEELVHLIINENKDFYGEIIDFGTGSGCIAIALAANLKNANLTGIDISADALALAGENANLNNARITLKQADILNLRTDELKMAGIIVSNPPYVRQAEKKLMAGNVLDFEPHQALFVEDSDPLVFYREILRIAEKILLPGGRIYFEINEAMGSQMTELMKEYKYKNADIVKDINGKERFVKATKNG